MNRFYRLSGKAALAAALLAFAVAAPAQAGAHKSSLPDVVDTRPGMPPGGGAVFVAV